MKHLFITGMGRSGTTLLDKLLASHRQIDILSQPLPLLFVEVKRQFLKSKGIDSYYVLNDDSNSRTYPSSDLDNYLKNISLSTVDLVAIFEKMRGYSGQSTKNDIDKLGGSAQHKGFKDILEKSLESYRIDPYVSYLGTKEIMCEEFIPYLCEMGYKCIVIIRDPRDVLASANYPGVTRYLGKKRPSLFILRSWRKSVEFTYLMLKHKNFAFLRYEDLVTNPYSELNKLTAFLGLDYFPDDYFEDGIIDRNGKVWLANSSFRRNESFISKDSKGIFKQKLSAEEQQYVEAICKPEMDWLNYQREYDVVKINSIENFRDTGVEYNRHLPADFSSQPANILKELDRLESLNQVYFQN